MACRIDRGRAECCVRIVSDQLVVCSQNKNCVTSRSLEVSLGDAKRWRLPNPCRLIVTNGLDKCVVDIASTDYGQLNSTSLAHLDILPEARIMIA